MLDWVIIGLLFTGLFTGFCSGFLGIGGGIIYVPVLVFVLPSFGVSAELSLHMAVATSLATVFFTSVAGAYSYWRRGLVQLEIVKNWVIYTLIGSVCGSLLGVQIEARFIALAFGLFCLFVASKLLWSKEVKVWCNHLPEGWLALLIPFLLGVTSSILGISGNAFGIVLLLLFSQNIRLATGTMSAMSILMSLTGAVSYMYLGQEVPGLPDYSLGYVHGLSVVALVSTAVVGAPLGVYTTKFLPSHQLQKIFGYFLILVSLRMLKEFWQ